MDMELIQKTTILFSPALHQRLTQIAAQRGTSLGDLVRTACEREYATAAPDDKVTAIRRMAELGLPVGDVKRMKRESVPSPDDLLP